jgi:hypothetical protein
LETASVELGLAAAATGDNGAALLFSSSTLSLLDDAVGVEGGGLSFETGRVPRVVLMVETLDLEVDGAIGNGCADCFAGTLDIVRALVFVFTGVLVLSLLIMALFRTNGIPTAPDLTLSEAA